MALGSWCVYWHWANPGSLPYIIATQQEPVLCALAFRQAPPPHPRETSKLSPVTLTSRLHSVLSHLNKRLCPWSCTPWPGPFLTLGHLWVPGSMHMAIEQPAWCSEELGMIRAFSSACHTLCIVDPLPAEGFPSLLVSVNLLVPGTADSPALITA